MAGHSKWAQIKHKKAVTDARKGKAYTKLGNAIAVAARQGGPDADKNFRLRLAVAKAKEANMPASNIERAIKRGSGSDAAQIDEVLYEGYGPGGVAIMAEAATDNRNRTAAEVRSVFTKGGGSLGAPGSVAFQFESKGQLFAATDNPQAAGLSAIEAGAEDVFTEDDGVRVYTVPENLDQIKSALESAGYKITDSEITKAPTQPLKVEDAKTAASAVRLLEALEELDDVTATYTNLDISPEVLAQVSG